jgi:hypothetical protein
LASTPAQDQLHTRQHSPGPSHGRIKQHSDDRTTRSVLNEPVSYTLPQPLDENGVRGIDENASELEKNIQLAFEEQEKSSSTTAPKSPRPHRHPAGPSHPPIDQEQDPLEPSQTQGREVGHGIVTSDIFVAQSSEIDGPYYCN